MQAIRDGDESMAITHLDRAATFLRAGIACEWDAANFSSTIYAEIVRPSMQMQDVPGGDDFSGDQNKAKGLQSSTELCSVNTYQSRIRLNGKIAIASDDIITNIYVFWQTKNS